MDDPRHVPIYSIPEAAGYLGLPVPTVRAWVTGRRSKSTDVAEPLITPAGGEPTALSFTNLVELHVLAALRRRHRVPMQQIRPAIDYLQDKLAVLHPLARRELLTDGLNLFTEHLGSLLNLTARGQIAIREIMETYLERVEHDEAGLAYRYYPYSRGDGRQAPKLIVIDPTVSFGRPVIAGSGVRTAVVAKFVKAGETISDLAEDYRLQPAQVEEAVRYELAA
jgi:uncharacterized protein (DUF433 family)